MATKMVMISNPNSKWITVQEYQLRKKKNLTGTTVSFTKKKYCSHSEIVKVFYVNIILKQQM